MDITELPAWGFFLSDIAGIRDRCISEPPLLVCAIPSICVVWWYIAINATDAVKGPTHPSLRAKVQDLVQYSPCQTESSGCHLHTRAGCWSRYHTSAQRSPASKVLAVAEIGAHRHRGATHAIRSCTKVARSLFVWLDRP